MIELLNCHFVFRAKVILIPNVFSTKVLGIILFIRLNLSGHPSLATITFPFHLIHYTHHYQAQRYC